MTTPHMTPKATATLMLNALLVGRSEEPIDEKMKGELLYEVLPAFFEAEDPRLVFLRIHLDSLILGWNEDLKAEEEEG